MEDFKIVNRRSDRNLKRRHEAEKCSDEQEDELKRLGLFETGMTVKQKQELMSIIEESRKCAIDEESVRQQHAILHEQSGISTVALIQSKDSKSFKTETLKNIQTCPSPDLFVDGEQEQSGDIHSLQHEPHTVINETTSNSKGEQKPNSVGDTAGTSNPSECIKKYNTNSINEINPWDCSEQSPVSCLRSTKRIRLQRKCNTKSGNTKYHALRILRHLEKYYQKLYKVQRQSLDYLNWGKAVLVGRHMEDTIDVFHRGKNFSVKYIADNELKTHDDKKASSDSQSDEGELDEFRPFILRSNIAKSWCKTSAAENSDAGESTIGPALKRPNETIRFKLEDEENSDNGDVKEPQILDTDDQPAASNQKSSDGVNKCEVFEDNGDRRKQRVVDDNNLGKWRTSHNKLSLKKLNKVHSLGTRTEDGIVRSRSPCPSTSDMVDANDKDFLMSGFKVQCNRIGLGKPAPKKLFRQEDKALSQVSSDQDIDDVGKKSSNERRKLNLAQVKKLSSRAKNVVADHSSKDNGPEQPFKRQRVTEVEDAGSNSTSSSSSSSSSSGTVELITISQTSPDSVTETTDDLPDVSQPTPRPHDIEIKDRSDRYPCPLCGLSFSLNVIENHAADCEGIPDEPLSTRTPRNMNRCYICRGTFSEQYYKDHVHHCITKKKLLLQSIPTSPSLQVGNDLKQGQVIQRCPKMNPTVSLVNCLDEYSLNNDSPTKLKNGDIARFPLRILPTMACKLNDGNISMSHITTSPFNTYQPISMQSNSNFDFKNQFRKGESSRQVTTKRRKSIKFKKRSAKRKRSRSKKR